MTTALAYCTSINAAETINDFLGVSKDQSDAAGTSWSIVRQTDQPTETKTTPPVDDFENDFHDWTPEQLENHHEERLPKSTGVLTHRVLAMLDTRSGQDKTVVMRSLVVTYSQENLDTANPDPEAEIRYWQPFRVKYEDAAEALAQLEQTQHLYLDRVDKSECYDEHGIFKVPK